MAPRRLASAAVDEIACEMARAAARASSTCKCSGTDIDVLRLDGKPYQADLAWELVCPSTLAVCGASGGFQEGLG